MVRARSPQDRQFTACHTWFLEFMARHRFSLRPPSTARPCNEEQYRLRMQRFHLNFVKFGLNAEPYNKNHELWGRWPPQMRANMDQTPIAPRNHNGRVICATGEEVVDAPHLKKTGEKYRLATLILTTTPHDPKTGKLSVQCRPALIFQGKAKDAKKRQEEETLYDDDCDVFWNDKAYFSDDVPAQWVDVTWRNHIANLVALQKAAEAKSKSRTEEEEKCPKMDTVLFLDCLKVQVCKFTSFVLQNGPYLFC